MNTEKEYMNIGKAVIAEFVEHGNERGGAAVLLRSVQHNGKLYIMMEDRTEIVSVWDYSDLLAVRLANRQQGARERADELAKKIRDEAVPVRLPQVVIVE